MNILLIGALIGVLAQAPPPGTPAPQPSLSAKREVLKSEVAISTLPLAELKTATAIEHDSEVARTDHVTVIVTIENCQTGTNGTCDASADVVAYKPDGSVHSEMKNVSLAAGRGTTTLKLAPADVTGVYKVVATVRDLNAKRFGKTERLFGVK